MINSGEQIWKLLLVWKQVVVKPEEKRLQTWSEEPRDKDAGSFKVLSRVLQGSCKVP